MADDPAPRPSPADGAAPAASLDRRLGPFDAAAIVVSNVIGGGIFFVPVLVAQLVPSAGALVGVWVLGGLLAFAGAMAYAELAAARPQAGGEYVYLREAFGRPAAFLTGWTSFIAGFSGAIAASAVALAEYAGRFIPVAADTTPLLTVPLPVLPLVVSPRAVLALTAIAALTCVHVRGLGPGRLVQNVLAGVKVSALVFFVAAGFALGRGTMPPLLSDGAAPASGWLLALVPVMFSYAGWNAAVYVAEEVRAPGRNVPLALGLGTAAVVVLYVALNLLYLYALPLAGLAALGNGRLVDIVAERLFGFVAGDVLALFSIISLAASISAMVLAGPRVYYAMARDGLFVPAAARVHPRFRTPAVAIVAQGVWSGVLVLSGTLSQLVNYTGFAVILFSGVAVAALFVLRRRDGGAARPFSAWGYPVAPAAFVAASAVIVANELVRNPRTSLTGLAIIGLGLPFYFLARTYARRQASASGPTA
jgi:APA family basic amino acid/polyamine antiporter